MATFTVEVSGSEKYILDVNTSTADNFNSTSSQDKFFLEIQQGTSGTAEANKNIIEITTSADSDSDASSLTIEKVNDINLVVTTDFVVSHPTISAASSVNNDGSLFIQDVLLDQYGHVTGLAAAYATGTGIGGGSSTFLNLTDTPSSFVGQGSKFVAVNSAASALEFVSGSISSSDTDAYLTGVSYDSSTHNLVLTTHSGSVTGVLNGVVHSGDNISLLVNDAGYATTGQLSSTSGYLQSQIDGVDTDTNTFVTGVSYSSSTHELVLTRNSGSVTGILNDIIHSGDNISFLVNDSGYINTETDPIFTASVAYNITSLDTGNWDSAYDWITNNSGTILSSGDNVSLLVNDANYAASGDNVSLFVNDAGYLTEHPTITAASSSDNSGRTYIQDILLDQYGHITGLATSSETGVEAYYAGTGLTLNGVTFHITGVDTSLLVGTVDNNQLTNSSITINAGTGLTNGGTVSLGDSINIDIDETVVQSGDNVSLLVNDANYVDGSGTVNYITKWSDNNTVTDSIIYDDGTNIGIGTNSPQTELDVSGNLTALTGYIDALAFNVDAEAQLLKGQISWDDTEGVISMGLTDTLTIHIGEQRFYRVRNQTGSPLYKGQFVYATGVHSNGIITPAKYIADSTIQEVRFIGVVMETVNNNNNGYVADFGHIQNIDMRGSVASNYAVGDETWLNGDILYAHATVAGKLTKNKPKHAITVAIILDNSSNGKMFVRPTTFGDLDDNHTVNTSGVTNGQFLQYNATTDYWVPSSSGNFTSLQLNGSGVLASGTTYHPIVSAASSSDNSGGTFIQDILLDSNGHVTGLATSVAAVSGDNISIFVNDSGYLTEHPTITAASSSDNSGRTYIQDILLDSYGHITGITTATETVTDTDTTYTAGTGLDLSGTEFNIDSTVLTTGSSISSLSNVNVSAPINNDQVLSYSSGFGFTNTDLGLNLMKRGSIPFGGYSDAQMGHYFFFDGSSEAVINTDGDDINFRVESTGNTHLLFVDAGTERVGINNSAPSHTLDISGIARVVHPDGLCGLQIEDEGGSGVYIGDCAFSQGDTFAGMKHSNHSLSGEYMIISQGTSTFVTSASGHPTFIRAGNGDRNYQAICHDDYFSVGDHTPADKSIPAQRFQITNSGAAFNVGTGNYDFKVYGHNNATQLIHADAALNRVGIGTATPAYQLDVVGTGSFDVLNINNAFTFPTGDGTAGHSLVTDGAGNIVFSGVTGGSGNLVRGSEVVTVTTGLFDVSGGYSVGTLDVYQNGIKLFEGASYDYTATNGTSFNLTNPATSGDLIEYLGLNTSTNAVGNTSLGTVTVTSNQDVFNTVDTFTSSNLAVFLNGVKLVDGEDYDVTSTSQFTLDSVATSGDIVEYIAYGATVASSNLQKTGDTMTGNLTVNADLIVKGYKETHTDNGNTGTAQTIDISNSTLQTYTLTGNCTFTMPTADAGRSFTMFLKTGAGSFSATFTGVKFPLNAAPTITTDANRMDLITFYSDGTNWYGNIQQEYHI